MPIRLYCKLTPFFTKKKKKIEIVICWHQTDTSIYYISSHPKY